MSADGLSDDVGAGVDAAVDEGDDDVADVGDSVVVDVAESLGDCGALGVLVGGATAGTSSAADGGTV